MPADYKILTDQSSDSLAERVTELINEGYDLIGGVQVNHVGHNATRYTQSIYRKTNDNPPLQKDSHTSKGDFNQPPSKASEKK